jgi:transcriptional regulator with XRE-family HTH domain
VNKKADNDLRLAFGKQVKKLRLAKGYSMRGFANEADIEYSQVVRIENGITAPTITTVFKIAETLNISLKDLFDFAYTTSVKIR